jgi:hypothetical protein
MHQKRAKLIDRVKCQGAAVQAAVRLKRDILTDFHFPIKELCKAFLGSFKQSLKCAYEVSIMQPPFVWGVGCGLCALSLSGVCAYRAV